MLKGKTVSKRCFKCMKEIKEDISLCPYCGFDNEHIDAPEYAMRPGTILHGQYLIGTVLGQGGFGITYVGYDTFLKLKVCIKEYYPMGQVSRSSEISNTVNWNRTQITREQWESSRWNFIQEAQRVERVFTLPGIVRIRNTFFENDSAYIVMDYIDGITLKDKLKQDGPMTFDECRRLFVPLMKSLEDLHRQNVIHRDISPDNIMVAEDGRLWLLDLDASKAIEDLQEGMSKLVMKKGFSPPEQYSTRVEIGPWTDVYALTVTMYYCITGKLIPDALDRMMKSAEISFDSGYGKDLKPEIKDVFKRGMDVKKGNRIQTVSELREALEKVDIKKKKTSRKSRKLPVLGILTVVGIVFAIGFFLNVDVYIKVSPVQNQEKNILMKADKMPMFGYGDEETYWEKAFHSDYDKEDILSITFVDTLKDIQQDAWDVSDSGDGSVMAWVVPNGEQYDLYIGADGQIMANKDCNELFAEYYSLKRIEFNDCFNTEMTENMQKMFADCGELEEIDIDNLNTENVTDMSHMFDGCQQIVKIDVTGFHTGKVKDMSHMFYDCESITNLNLESFDTGKVKYMNSMFQGCVKLINLDISNFNTEHVTNMKKMFYECEKLENVDISKIVTDQVINSDYMYAQCFGLDGKVDFDVYEIDDSECFDVAVIGRCKYADMYSKPDKSSEVLGQIPAGTQVEIIQTYVGNYFFAEIAYNDQNGYIFQNYLVEND